MLSTSPPRYEKTGTPLNKELREYVEEMNKAKAKVEPETVGAEETAEEAKDQTLNPKL